MTLNPDTFRREVEANLHDNILRFWRERMVDESRGGFLGRIDGAGNPDPAAPKGAILCGRILWAFAAAYRVTRRPEYLEVATRARDYLLGRFYDTTYGGVYWSLTPEGAPLDTKKQIYALGVAIYGLSEYARATGDETALEYARRLCRTIEEHSFDPQRNGYFEAFTREWAEIGDVRLSDKDANERKTMNTHLHILEPYTNLYRVWPDSWLRERLRNLIGVFLDRIYDPATHHLGLFFSEEWERRDAEYSYGHDIEASWLLLEAAQVVGDEPLTARVTEVTRKIAAAAAEGIRNDGSMIYERHADGTPDEERHWWVQAENVVGQLWLWRFHGDQTAYGRAAACWTYIRDRIVDPEGGEWWWGILPDGREDRANDKAGFWKCPYHNTRMCLEAMALLR